MGKNNVRVKRSLMLQSFAPLFLLLTIKHLDIPLFWELICKLPKALKLNGPVALWGAVNHPAFGSLFVSFLGAVWLLMTLLIAIGFEGMHTSGFKAEGESVIVMDSQGEGSASFLVTYVLPLLSDDLSSLRALIVFLLMLSMIVALLINSGTFYFNPILTAFKYKVVTFKFLNPESDIKDSGREYIGITHGKEITDATPIKRKYISDGVFLIYNTNT